MSIFTLALDPAQNPHPLLNSDERVGFAQFSPDGKSIVFSSNIDGSDEIYIQSYQAAQPHRWRVSTQGGTQPRWTSLGREIVYLGTDGKLESVPVKMKGNELELGNPKTLFAYPPLLGTYSAYQFDVSPNGDRFVFLSAPPGRQAPPLRIILNWESLLTQ